MATTPHYFNLISPDDPDCPIRRQVVPPIEETLDDPAEMLDPCGEDTHMPVPRAGASLPRPGALSRHRPLRQLPPLLHAEPRAHTTGYAVPQFVIDAPGGGGKVAINPDYVLLRDEQRTLVRNYDGAAFEYHETAEMMALR